MPILSFPILIFSLQGSSNLSLDFGGGDVGAQDPHSCPCWRHIQRMGVQVDKLHQGLSAEVVCPEQWAVVILQVKVPGKCRNDSALIMSPEMH